MKKKTGAAILIITALSVIILNIKVPTKQGVDYEVCVYKIPLYIKIIEFVNRDYRYRALSRGIVQGKKSDKDKVMAILKWVASNIKTDAPDDWPIYDDHILNIIIRGYGEEDQINDVFTMLCMYSDLPAGWVRIEEPLHRTKLVLSFVKVDNRWRVFDVFRNTYFINNNGDIASVKDILSKRYTKKKFFQRIDTREVHYEDYFINIDNYLKDITLRAKKQMPLHRALYEIIDFFNPDDKEKESKS